MLKQAWSDAGKPCHFDDVLAMFLPDRQYIEDENGYSVSALTKGIIANVRAGNLEVIAKGMTKLGRKILRPNNRDKFMIYK